MDIGAIVSERLSAVRKLQENPNDLSAKMVLDNAQKQVCNTFEDEQLGSWAVMSRKLVYICVCGG